MQGVRLAGIQDYGHLEGHYPTVTCERQNIETITVYFHVF